MTENIQIMVYGQQKQDNQSATWCHLTVGKAATSAQRLVVDGADYADMTARLHAELAPRDRRTEAMTLLATFRELGRKIRALVDIAMEGVGEDVLEQQAIQTFLRAIPATLSLEVQRVESNTMEEACQEVE